MIQRRALLLLGTVIAIRTLPTALFPPMWLAACTLPAAVYSFVRTVSVPRIVAVPTCLVLQFLLAGIARSLDEGLTPIALTGASLLPPLAFSAARAVHADVHRSLFLAFCVVLIGSILGEPHWFALAAFLTVSLCSLHAEQLLLTKSKSMRIARGVGYGLAGVIFSVLLHRGIGHAIWRTTGQAPSGGNPTVGLSRDFRLDAGGDLPLSLVADKIVEVRNPSGVVPSKLYLRSHAFERAGLDGWEPSPQRNFVPAQWSGWFLRSDLLEVDERRISLEIRLIDPVSDFAYVPARTTELHGPVSLMGDREQLVFQFDSVPPNGTLLFSDITPEGRPDVRDRTIVDPMWTSLPQEIDERVEFFKPLLLDPAVQAASRSGDAMRLALALTGALQSRHEYQLRTPAGPYGSQMLNFLQEGGRGYCMHFASALAICLRRQGVPCRLATGLFGGTLQEDGTRLFGSRHAHAWVEIPYEGAGFVVVDPTPPAALDGELGRLWPEQDSDTGIEEVARSVAQAFDSEAKLPDWWWFFGAIPVTLGFAAFWFFSRRSSARRSNAPRAPKIPREPHRKLQEVLRTLREQGHVRTPNEPLTSFADRVVQTGKVSDVLQDVLAAYNEVRFGGQPWNDGRRDRLDARRIRTVSAES
ncbi:MAG: transglutaminase domain-containing protein [Planctomycetota bacterium]